MPNIVYTIAEKVEMVRQHEQGLSYQRISDHFAAAYPDRPVPSKSTIYKIIKRFHNTGNLDLSLRKLSYPSRQLSQETKINICLKAEEQRKKPLGRIGQELEVSKTSVHRTLRSEKCRLFKQKQRKLRLERNKAQRKNFTNSAIDHVNANPGHIDRKCFSDESTIQPADATNRQIPKTTESGSD